MEEQTLPLLFSSLPDQAPSQNAATERAKYWRVLSALTTLCTQSELFETLVIRLTTKLDLVCVPAAINDTDAEPSAAYAHSILQTLQKTLAVKVDEGHADVPKYIERLVPRMFNLLIYSAVVPEGGTYMPATHPRVISVAGQIIGLVAQVLSVQ